MKGCDSLNERDEATIISNGYMTKCLLIKQSINLIKLMYVVRQFYLIRIIEFFNCKHQRYFCPYKSIHRDI
jgi:hypothetical protein